MHPEVSPRQLTGRKPTGPHRQRRLDALRIRNLAPGKYGDGNGLYLIVEPSGSKHWLLRVVVKGRRREIGLGGTGMVTLGDAREEARQLRRIARAGGDPLVERRRARQTIPTFEEFARQVHADRSEAFRNHKHRAQWLSQLTADVFPVIGKLPVDAVETADVLNVLKPIWKTKSETARRLKQRMKVIFDTARISGLRTAANPVEGVTLGLAKLRQEKRHHPALPYQRVPPFIQQLRESEVAGESVRLALEFLILTASRTGEVLHATWDEVDVDSKVWTIPASRMKAGQSHRVPLANRACEILRRMKDLVPESRHLFPGRRAEKPLSNMTFLMLLRRLGYRAFTAHGFRSSFRDWASERTNAPHAVCEAALAHTIRNKAEAAYHRTDLFDRRAELMAQWERFVSTAPAVVISLRA